jgi:ectoine hydroxylase-related dioxygenase (phytanoyl-CoA dioxygenase family)
LTNSNILIDGLGYVTVRELIPEHLIDSINLKLDTLYPIRASSSNKQYAEGKNISKLPDISVWWSQLTMDWPEVIEINNIIQPLVADFLDNIEWYASDIVTIAPESTWINPHVDTPHRFSKYNYDQRLLGVQCIVALQDTDHKTGSTGIVACSQTHDWDINKCYNGTYDSYFKVHCMQPIMPKGSLLMYNCRLLHSSMPNYSPKARPALLLNYLNGAIMEDVKKIDNIWKSNNGE